MLFRRIRGILGTFLTLSLYLGILISFIIGSYVPYQFVPYTMLLVPILFLLNMIVFVPESPQFLLSINKYKVMSYKIYNHQYNAKHLKIDAL